MATSFLLHAKPKMLGQLCMDLMVCEPSLSMFVPVEMPAMSADLKHRLHCCDTSEGQVFLQINHEGDGAVWGHLYVGR